MDAYDYCRHLVETWPDRWTGSPGEKESGDWMEQQLARMGYETRQMPLPCPGWEYEGEELYLEGERLDAGGQFYSVGCDVTGPLAAVEPDGDGGFRGEAHGRIALLKESDTREVQERNLMLMALESAGALAAIMESEYPDTYSTKMFRTPESRLPAAGVSGQVGEKLFDAVGKEARLVIRARQTQSTTSNVLGEIGPADGPVLLVCAHHEASPGSPGAYDNASGVGVILEMAERLTEARCGARLRFAGWGGHEFGILGSQWYVENHPDEVKEVKRFLVFDAVGARESDPELRVWGGDRLMDAVRAWGEGQGDVRVLAGSGGAGDATHFLRAGVEAVWVTAARWRTGDLYGREDRQWRPAAPFHSPLDDMRWIDRDAMGRAVEVGLDLVRQWCAEFGVACEDI
jgi:aminopeptidase YwaD